MPQPPLSRRRLLALVASLALLPLDRTRAQNANVMNGQTVALGDFDLKLVDQEWNVARHNLAVSGKPLSIGGRAFASGVGTHALSRILLRLDGCAQRFKAFVGVDDGSDQAGSVRFAVVDGSNPNQPHELWSATHKKGQAPLEVDVDISRVRWLLLLADGAGDGIAGDHADWCHARLEGVKRRLVPAPVPSIQARMPHEESEFWPGRLWTDTNERPIQAHGGGLLRHEGKWWWHGESRAQGYIAVGVQAYSSSDLLRWEDAGIVLSRSAYDAINGEQTLCERPKVIFNPATKKFVMWFHYDRAGYGDSRAGVAIADHPAGPYKYLGAQRPIETSTFRDMGVFVDDDGRAYVFYAGEENQTMHVVRLNAEWTAPEMPMVEGETWARILIGKARESPSPFKHAGKYFLITSGTTGWAPNPGDLAVSDNPLGPYKSLGNPFKGAGGNTSFRSQSTFVIPHPGAPAGSFIYLGDRWKPEALADARYVWLPFRVTGAGENTNIEWKERWKLGV